MCSEKDIIKLNTGKYVVVPKWLTIIRMFISPIILLSGIFYLGQFTKEADGRMFDSNHQKEEVLRVVSTVKSYEEQIKVFVPRTEVEYKLQHLQENQEKIMDKLNVN